MAKKNSGLGRGLDAIFLDNSIAEENTNTEEGVKGIKISLIDPKRDQPRKYFDKEALEELASSISEHGLLQPILVREYGDGRYQIIAGERRFRASKLAGLTEIPALVVEKDDATAAQLALIENIQREDLNPLEEAMAYKALAEEYHMTQEELSQKIGKSDCFLSSLPFNLNLSAKVRLHADFKLSEVIYKGNFFLFLFLNRLIPLFNKLFKHSYGQILFNRLLSKQNHIISVIQTEKCTSVTCAKLA